MTSFLREKCPAAGPSIIIDIIGHYVIVQVEYQSNISDCIPIVWDSQQCYNSVSLARR
jgi:hypothetical protein